MPCFVCLNVKWCQLYLIVLRFFFQYEVYPLNISYYLMRMHSHGRLDNIFSLISGVLSMTSCFTLETFVHVVQHLYKPTPTMTLLKKNLDFHGWLKGAFSMHHSCFSHPRQFMFSKNDNAGSTVEVVKAMARCSECTKFVLGEPLFPLQRLPNKKPRWNVNRPVFSK